MPDKVKQILIMGIIAIFLFVFGLKMGRIAEQRGYFEIATHYYSLGYEDCVTDAGLGSSEYDLTGMFLRKLDSLT